MESAVRAPTSGRRGGPGPRRAVQGVGQGQHPKGAQIGPATRVAPRPVKGCSYVCGPDRTRPDQTRPDQIRSDQTVCTTLN